MSDIVMRFLPAGLRSILIELAGLDETLALNASLIANPIDGIEEIIPAARTLMIHFRPEVTSPEKLAAEIRTRNLSSESKKSSEIVYIPVEYTGEDLEEVARLTGLSPEEVVRRHIASEFVVAFCGFAPGFGYLAGGDQSLHVPRRQTPRTKVPAGAVALAGAFSGVYPQASPGGWQIIGTTPLHMWDIERDPPALLQPGSHVRFYDLAGPSPHHAHKAVSGAFQPILSDERSAPGKRSLTVKTAPVPAVFQDLGRFGKAGQGVSASGALDRGALKAANHAVGNPSGFACLEITMGGFSFEVSDRMVIALGGACCPITITSLKGERLEGRMNSPLSLEPGDIVTLGYPVRGMRSYLAVRGGYDVASVLGSCATDTLAQVGPAPVTTGVTLAVREAFSELSSVCLDKPLPTQLPSSSDLVTLDIVLGPRADWFTEEGVRRLEQQIWQVTPKSNRIGLRLAGEKPLERIDTAELPSEGTVTGAIQVPHDGQPVLFLADHPLTGGYPVVGVVADYHLDLAGQLPIGARIRFKTIRPFASF